MGGGYQPGEGFLVEDKGNGQIALFGNATQDGFAALRRFDSNQDGQISALDQNFASLAIWRDVNGDGTLDAGERLSLAEAGVAAISLQTTESSAVVGDTRIGFTSTFTRTDGTTALAETAYFSIDTALSRWIAPPGFSISAEADLLPALSGYGLLQDLQVAATLRPEILADAKALALRSGSLSGAELRSAFETLVQKWAGVDGELPELRMAA